MSTSSSQASAAPPAVVMQILFSVAFVHLLNDCVQAVLPAIYPLLKDEFALSFTQIGLITLTFQCTASLLQPWIGLYTDRRPIPFLLPAGMCVTLGGVALLATAGSFAMLLLAAGLIGIGSSTFHPEASRVARLASGGRFGFAQSLFQVGGNLGSAFGPLLAAAIIVGQGQGRIAWLMLLVLLAVAVLVGVSRWYAGHLRSVTKKIAVHAGPGLSRGRVIWALTVLALLVFSKYIYMASLSSYYTFYLIERFHVSVEAAQMYLFLFLAAVAAGTFAGGPIGDRIGRKRVIWFSILGAAPFALALPYASLFWTAVLSVVIGLVMSSAFSAIVVFAQELVPDKVGMIAGLFFGLMFGISGIGAAVMGAVADTTGIEYVYRIASFLPLLGILAVLLPRMPSQRP
ncbi:MFS transporter [Massilia varians]|uniref:MFS transporter n=1 Tax=Massilia varians TaxID=457921 RepID=UPI002553BE3D|nr:MFS transporter [Massilia varians]MDK6075535.1 MFS transporter [Massilia varians]